LLLISEKFISLESLSKERDKRDGVLEGLNKIHLFVYFEFFDVNILKNKRKDTL
jgi:hypothetical protein